MNIDINIIMLSRFSFSNKRNKQSIEEITSAILTSSSGYRKSSCRHTHNSFEIIQTQITICNHMYAPQSNFQVVIYYKLSYNLFVATTFGSDFISTNNHPNASVCESFECFHIQFSITVACPRCKNLFIYFCISQ